MLFNNKIITGKSCFLLEQAGNGLGTKAKNIKANMWNIIKLSQMPKGN
jgi:hypothetical protein